MARPPRIANLTIAPATGWSFPRSRTSTTGATAVFCWMMLTASSPLITMIFSPAARAFCAARDVSDSSPAASAADEG